MWALSAVDPWGARAWAFAPALAVSASSTTGAAGALADVFARHRVVILQERHAAPETRLFGARMIDRLAEAGATHLAFESSLQLGLDRLARSGVVRPGTETYAFDPSRAALLRAARTAGLRMVAFDFPPEGQLKRTLARLARRGPADAPAINRERERSMAENIVHLILAPSPEARVVVWTGEQHAMKRVPEGWWGPFMAMRLTELTGEEPFCVGQELVDQPDLAGEPRLVDGSHPWARERGLDAIVLHHRGPAPSVPGWLLAPPAPIAADGAELVQAIPAQEGEQAVPAAQQLTHGADEVRLHLTPGEYLLRGVGGEDRVLWRRVESVSP